MFQSKRWVGMTKKYLKPEILASLPYENFLNIRKNRNTLAIRSLEKNMQTANKITFFLPHYRATLGENHIFTILAANLCPKRFYNIMVYCLSKNIIILIGLHN
jgi:hypothetical protein